MTTKEFQERSALRIFLPYFKPHMGLFVLDMICALIIALIDLVFPYISRWCMYELLPQNAYQIFFAVMAAAAAAFAVGTADRIAAIENGRVTELGRHDALMAKNGAYAALVRTQELNHG